MTEYDVILIFITIAGFVISTAGIGVRFTKAVTEVKGATEALRDAVAELRSLVAEIKEENRKEHLRFEERIKENELRIARLETERNMLDK